MREIEEELLGEAAAVGGGETGGCIGRDADLSGGSERGFAREGDDVGRGRWIGQKVPVNPGQGGVGQKDDR